ncbi:MAG: excisionase family DNA-binding protein [Blastocatellia bacterium]
MRDEVKYRSDLRVLSRQTRQQIEQDIKRLSESLAAGRPVRLRLGDDQETDIALPVATVELIREALTLERDGKGFLLLEEDAEVSPEKAAEMLRISRPTLLKKLDSGEIPFHYVGSHRRIAVADVLAYRSKQKERAQAALQQMRDEADELGIYE